jgi:hypothetical protein
MLQARPHAIHFKPVLDFGEGQHRDGGAAARCFAKHSVVRGLLLAVRCLD